MENSVMTKIRKELEVLTSLCLEGDGNISESTYVK